MAIAASGQDGLVARVGAESDALASSWSKVKSFSRTELLGRDPSMSGSSGRG